MIAGNSERIALVIETEAKLEGIKQARTEVMGLGRMASDVFREGRQASLAQAAAQGELQKAFQGDIAALAQYGRALDVTNRQAVRGFRESVAAQRELMIEAKATTTQFQQLDAVLRNVEQRAKGARGSNMIVDPKSGEAIDKMSPKLRTAANAATTLSFAAVSARSGFAGAAIAAGTLSASLATLTTSARIAASATGIGAIVTIGLTAVTVLQSLKKEAYAASDSVKRIISEVPDADVAIGYARAQRAKMDALQAIIDAPAWEGRKTFEKRDARQRALEAAIENEVLWHNRLVDARRNIAKRDASEAEAQAERVTRITEAALEKRAGLLRDYELQANVMWLSVLGDEDEAARVRARAAHAAREREIAELEEHFGRKESAMRTHSQSMLDAELKGIDDAAAARRRRAEAQIADLKREADTAEEANRRGGRRGVREEVGFLFLGAKDAEQSAEEAEAQADFDRRKAQIEAEKIQESEKNEMLEQLERVHQARMAGIEKSAQERRQQTLKAHMDAYIKGGESLSKTLKRMAVEPIVTHLRGVAIDSAIAAARAWPNPIAMAKYGAVAVAAMAAAREVAQLGGAGGGGGSAGSGGGGGSDRSSPTFEARSPSGQGGNVTNLTIIVRRDGRQEVQQTIYDLQRAAALKMGGMDMRVVPTLIEGG